MTRIEQSINRVVEQVVSQTDLINQIKTLLAEKASATFDFGWAVEQIHDVNGFILTEDGYYKNTTNNNNASFCKIKFKTGGGYNLAIECMYSGDSSSDFCLLSKINTDLNLNNVNDYTDTTVQKVFSGNTGNELIRETVIYNDVTDGTIMIKCYKNNIASNKDCFYFRVKLLPRN